MADFLQERNPAAAKRAMDAIEAGLLSLSEMAERGYRARLGSMRQLFVPFGRAGYVMQYLVDEGEVVVLRIIHALEDR
nr:type II toxin-antitoxin system RelE/ParE family toxin [Caulobacter mirabilis]